MYLGANNSSTNCRQTLAIHTYTIRIYIIALTASMQLKKMLYCKIIVNVETFMLKD